MTEVIIVVLLLVGLLVILSRVSMDGTLKIVLQVIVVILLAVFLLREFGPALVG